MEFVKVKHINKGKCDFCNCNENHCLDLFKMGFRKTDKEIIKFVICDKCVEQIFDKTLRINCKVNSRVKNNRDLAIINKRNGTTKKIEHKSIN